MYIEKRPDNIIVYQVSSPHPEELQAWVTRVRQDLAATGSAPLKLLYNLSACGRPSPTLLTRLREAVSAGREVKMCCAVVTLNQLAAQIMQTWSRIPEVEDEDTLTVRSRKDVWSPDSKVEFFDNFDAAVNWLQSAC